ncbi:MAG TPA: metallophosphoesterase [Candidatus Binataceae bacterium]|nr:metallophosphoesterase [Candidatus Binataceae bacterium]
MSPKQSSARARTQPLHTAATPKEKRPLPLRPLHNLWRRTIDQIDVTRVTLPVRGLPGALSGVVACQMSDFHVDRDEDLERLHGAVERINREEPELVFLTGDYFSGPRTMEHYLDEFTGALSRLAPRVGVFAVAGNHDHWSSIEKISRALDRAGIDLLANSNRRIRIRNEHLVIVGIDDLWSRRAEPSRAFQNVSHGDATIVLAHNPDTALYARHLHPGVMLSGHTHGGVVRIPLYGSPLRSILKIGKEYYSGLNRYGDFFIYTNRGLGTFWVRIRINCRPEVSRFKLAPIDQSIAVDSQTAAAKTAHSAIESGARRHRIRPISLRGTRRRKRSN